MEFKDTNPVEGVVQRVRSRVLKTEPINWRTARWLQNESLKDIDQASMDKLKVSMVKNNFVMPFNVWQEDESTIWILDGHHRQKALDDIIKNGVLIDGQVKFIEVPELLPATFIDCADKKEAAKLVLIYSSIYAKIQNAGLDEFLKMHQIEFEEVKLEIDLPDFSMPRFEQKFNPLELDEDEDFYEAEDIELSDIVVKRGDIFLLNQHKLYCGDYFNKEVWVFLLEELGGKKADVVFTDPPYNLPADYIGNKGETKHDDFAMAKGEMTDHEFKDFLKDVMQTAADLTKDGAIHYICMDFRHAWHMCQAGFEVYGSYDPKQLCVWNKSNGANGSFYRAKHELIFCYKSGTAKHFSKLELKDRVRYNVWDYPSAGSFSNPDRDMIKEHPTPKPVSMVIDALEDVSEPQHLVLDFFLGSGTTLIAADFANRICYGTEIEPKHCQTIIRRYVKHCQKQGKELKFSHLNGDLSLEDIIKPKTLENV